MVETGAVLGALENMSSKFLGFRACEVSGFLVSMRDEVSKKRPRMRRQVNPGVPGMSHHTCPAHHLGRLWLVGGHEVAFALETPWLFKAQS